MSLSSIQQGLIVQFEFAKYLMLGSRGLIELNPPLTDDDRRDYEIHVRGLFGFALAMQIKSSMHLHRMSKGVDYLNILFDVAAERLISSPYFYYFFAYLDPKLMRLADPVFLIPSAAFHELAAPRKRNGVWQFTMAASMELQTRDKWHEFRSTTTELGQQMLAVVRSLSGSKAEISPELLALPDLYWIRRK